MKLISWWKEKSLISRILMGIFLGTILGLVCPKASFIGILGQVFVGALKAIAPILVAVLVTSSIAKANGGLGVRFRTVILLYLLSTLLAAIVAVCGSFIFPITLSLSGTTGEAIPGGLSDIFNSFVSNIVANPIDSIAKANYLGILFWAIVMGMALRCVATENTINAITDLSYAISKAVKWIIGFAPFGVLGLVFSSISENGPVIFYTYGKLIALLVGCMLFSALVLNPLIVGLCLRTNPYPLVWKCLKESGLNAFFTRSSAANIPVNMNLCKRLGLEEDFYSVSIPLGATINMNGAAVTITVMTLAVCHTMGIHINPLSTLLLCITATLAACGSSGVAGGSLLLIPMACSLFGIDNNVAMQAVAVGFIIGVIQDSVETALNSSGDVLFTATAELLDRKKKHCN